MLRNLYHSIDNDISIVAPNALEKAERYEENFFFQLEKSLILGIEGGCVILR